MLVPMLVPCILIQQFSSDSKEENMLTFHFNLINSKKRKNGEIPIYLRIMSQRKYRLISTGLTVEEKHWNENSERVRKTHPNSNVYNVELEKFLIKAKDAGLKLQQELDEEPSAEAVKDAIQGKDRSHFFPYAEEYLEKLEKRDKFWQHRVLNPVIDKLKDFAGDELLFENITPHFLQEFETYLRVECKNNQNTIYKNLSNLRRVIKQAVDDQVIPMQLNPFNN